MNYRLMVLMVALVGLVASGVISGEMDEIDKKLAKEAPLFERAKMRGRVLDEVSRDVIKQTPGDGYQLRSVDWWPKKGVDIIEEPKGEPRTWTIRQTKPEEKMKWWPRALRGKKQFKAHLLGFRGIAAAQDPWKDDVTEPYAPAVVLRLPDGRKRCFVRGSFSDEDEKYLVDLYEKQMKVLRDNTFEEGFERIPRTVGDEELSDNPLYTPGTTHISSKHFTATLGSEPPDDGYGSKWLNAEDKEGAALNRKLIMRGWEDWWAYLEHGGHLMFYSEHLGPKYKYSFLVGGTKKDGEMVGRGFGGGYGACSGGDGSWWGLYHEWGHGIPSGNQMELGGGETLCDTGQIIGDPGSIHKCMFQVIKPWKNLFWGWYPGAYAWSVIGDDPNWGYVFPYAIARMMSDKESSPMHVIARVGEKRGIFKDGIRETGDLLGQVGARFAEFDNELEAGLRGLFGFPTRVVLLEVDRENRRYRCDPKSSPEAFGVNLARLVPDQGAKELTVDFHGHYDAKVYSDWRVCIVAVDQDGKCRYSPLWNKGTMTMKTQPGDLRYWLTVTATPTALSPTTGPMRERYQAAGVVYQGGFGYRYPYDVALKGCRAGSPHSTPIDDETYGQAGLKSGRNPGEGLNSAAIPVTDTEQRQHAEEVLAAMEDHAKGSRWANAAKWHLKNMKGKRHPKGGGWVADTATVDETAYVGPHAMVLDEAKVLDDAVIEDYVIVYGNAIFRDNARAYGKLAVEKGVFSKDARMYIRNERKWSTQKVTVPEDSDAPQKRYAQLMKAPPMQANFDIVQAETSLLEDHFNERSGTIYGSHRDDRIFFDGVLIGNPGFTYDGVETGAVTFNGKDQWAEMPGELADLEMITVDVRFKVDSAKQQTVWMFGNDASSQLSLSVAGGELVLLGQGGGKQAVCRGGKVVSDQWTTVRAELDGATMKLFQDGKTIVEMKTDFRASDAFTPGKVRMATLGAGFGGATPMAGAVDYLRFFTEVLDDFEAAEIPMVNPRHLCPRFLARFEARYPDFHAKRIFFEERKTWSHPLYLYYAKFNSGLKSRTVTLSRMSGNRVAEMENKIASLKQRRQEIDQERNEARQNDQSHKEREKQLRPQMDELRKKRDAILMANAKFKEMQKRSETLNREINALRQKAEEELKKTPAYSTLLENIETKQKAVHAMKEGSAERNKEDKQLRELHDQRNRMIQDRQWGYPVATNLQKEQFGHGQDLNRLRNSILGTSEWKEADRKYKELEKQTRYQPDPKFAREQKQLEGQIQKMEQELKLLTESAAAEANPLEAQLLQSSSFAGQAYHHAIAHQVLLGMLPTVPDDVAQLDKARKLQNRPWPTTVDWDGRAEYEKENDVIAQPIMQHYLKRMKPWMYK